MKKRKLCILFMGLCLLGLIRQVCYLEACEGSLLITGTFSKEQSAQFQSILNSDSLITSCGSYTRTDWVLVQDQHERRYIEASAISSSGDYTPSYAIRICYGRFLLPQDQGKIVLCATQASALFCTYDCIGRTALIDDIPYEVVGVYEPSGSAASLSRIGLQECFISAMQPQDNWIITITCRKETQREFTLPVMLSRLGVRDVTVTPLFRSRGLIRFALCLQADILLCIATAQLWQWVRPFLKRTRPMIQRLVFILMFFPFITLLGFTFSIFPLNPYYLPTAFTSAAIGRKLNELLILFNNRVDVRSMESNYMNWLSYGICLLSACFWTAQRIYHLKRRDHRA